MSDMNNGISILRRLIESTKAQGGACLWSVADFKEMIDEIEKAGRDLKDDGRGHPLYSGPFELDASEPDKDREGDDVLRAFLHPTYPTSRQLAVAIAELCRRALGEKR